MSGRSFHKCLLLVSCALLFTALPETSSSASAASANQEREAVMLQSIKQSCRMSVIKSERGDCKRAIPLLAEAASRISALKTTDEATLAAYKEASQALELCASAKADAAADDTETTEDTEENTAPGNKHAHNETKGEQCENEGEAWREPCPSALLEGKITKQCKRGRIVTVTNTCKEPESCGDHLSGTSWVEETCPEGTVGSMKFRCNMGKKFRVYDDNHMCKETQCTLPDGTTMKVGTSRGKQCGEVRRMFTGTNTYTGFNGDLGVAVLSCQNVGSKAKILINGNRCTTAKE